MTAFVVDASIVSAWALVDEQRPATDELLRRAAIDGIAAPILLWFEIRNVLVIQGRRGRIHPAERDEFLDAFEGLPLRLDRAADSQDVIDLALQHRLTVYDAAYLELSRRLRLPLATLDRPLARAAVAELVEVLPPR